MKTPASEMRKRTKGKSARTAKKVTEPATSLTRSLDHSFLSVTRKSFHFIPLPGSTISRHPRGDRTGIRVLIPRPFRHLMNLKPLLPGPGEALTADEGLARFLRFTEELGLTLYSAQEEA